LQRLTLRIVAKALFNVDLRAASADLGPAFATALHYMNRLGSTSLETLPLDLPFTPYGRFLRAKAVLDAQVEAIIAEHRRAGEDVGDMLSILLSARDEARSTIRRSRSSPPATRRRRMR
jgi:cytochrome P450